MTQMSVALTCVSLGVYDTTLAHRSTHVANCLQKCAWLTLLLLLTMPNVKLLDGTNVVVEVTIEMVCMVKGVWGREVPVRPFDAILAQGWSGLFSPPTHPTRSSVALTCVSLGVYDTTLAHRSTHVANCLQKCAWLTLLLLLTMPNVKLFFYSIENLSCSAASYFCNTRVRAHRVYSRQHSFLGLSSPLLFPFNSCIHYIPVQEQQGWCHCSGWAPRGKGWLHSSAAGCDWWSWPSWSSTSASQRASDHWCSWCSWCSWT